MTDLVDAYQRDDIHRYESVLRENQDVLADPFIAENIDEVSRNMRTKAVLKLIAPYSRFTLKFIAKHIRISLAEVQEILGVLIVEKKLRAKIDQEQETVLVESTSDTEHLQRLHEWSTAINNLWSTVLTEGEGFKTEDNNQGGFNPIGQGGFGAMDFLSGNGAGPRGGRGPKMPGRGGKLMMF